MAIKYEFISQDEMDDAIAENLRGRELEHFHYDLNHRNYVEMLKTLPAGNTKGTPEEREQAAYRTYIEGLVKTEAAAREKTEVIYAALAENLKDPARKAAATQRVSAKIAAREARDLGASPDVRAR